MEKSVATKEPRPMVAHPSIRVKGLEGGWEPVVCTNDDCEFRERVNHMHCPLCPRKVCSQDVAYMKMHFRVKHIDEGVDCEEAFDSNNGSVAGNPRRIQNNLQCHHCLELGFINLKCWAQCRVIHQKERVVRTPHWHCHRCSLIATKKRDLLAHFDSSQIKAKHDASVEILVMEDINQGMNQLKKEENLPPSQIDSNKHDVTTQTPSELSGIQKARTSSTSPEDGLSLSREEEAWSGERRQLMEEKEKLEREIHSLMKGKTTMENTIKHLQKESKRFKEKLLRVSRDNTKLKRQLKILTAIALIPSRNKTSQGTPSSRSGSSQSEEIRKSVSSSLLTVSQSRTTTSLATSTSTEVHPPTRSLFTSNNHLVRSNISLPVVVKDRTILLQPPTSTSKKNHSVPQFGELRLQVVPVKGSGLTINAEHPVTSKSSVGGGASGAVAQSPVLAGVKTIMSTNSSPSTKNPISATTEQMAHPPSVSSARVQSQSSSGTAACRSVSSNTVIPRNYPSDVLASDSLNLCQVHGQSTTSAPGNLSVLTSNDASSVIPCCPSSEAFSKKVCRTTESCKALTTQGISSVSSANGVAISSASHTAVAKSTGNVVSMGNPDAVAPPKAVAEDERVLSTNGSSICENTTLNSSKKASSVHSGRRPLLSSLRSNEKVTKNNDLWIESSSMLLMHLASKAMERLRNNTATKRPAEPVTSSTQTNKRLCRNKRSNSKQTNVVPSGNSNARPTGRKKSLLNSGRRRSLPSSGSAVVPVRSSSECGKSRVNSVNDVRPGDIELPVSTSVSPTTPESMSTDVISKAGDEVSVSDGNPQLVSLEVLNELSTSLSNPMTVSSPEVTDDDAVHISRVSDSPQEQESLPRPSNVTESDRRIPTHGEVGLAEGTRLVTQDLALPTEKPNDNTGNCPDSNSSSTNQSSLSSDESNLLEETEQTNLSLLDSSMELSVPEAPVETIGGGFASGPNSRALKRTLAHLVEMDFASLSPDLAGVVDSDPGSPSTSISTPSNEGSSLFSSDGTDSLLDLHDYDLPFLAESFPPLGREERYHPDDLSDTESFLELCNRFGGGQDVSILDQLPSMLDDRDNQVEFSSFAPQLSAMSSIDLDNEQSLLDRDSFLIDLANFWDNNFSLSSLFTLRGGEDNQPSNQKEPVALPLTSILQRSSKASADTSVTGDSKMGSPCGRTSEESSLQSEPGKRERATSSSRKAKRKKSKGKKRHRSREKGHKPKKTVCQY